MKNYYFLCVFFFTSCFYFTGIAQEDPQVKAWIQSNSHVLLFENEVYSNFSEEEKSKIGQHIIVFNGQLTLNDLMNFETTNPNLVSNPISFNSNSSATVVNAEQDQIKNWLTENSTVKIVTRLEYNQLSAVHKAELINSNALILKSEVIVLEDVINFKQ